MSTRIERVQAARESHIFFHYVEPIEDDPDEEETDIERKHDASDDDETGGEPEDEPAADPEAAD